MIYMIYKQYPYTVVRSVPPQAARGLPRRLLEARQSQQGTRNTWHAVRSSTVTTGYQEHLARCDDHIVLCQASALNAYVHDDWWHFALILHVYSRRGDTFRTRAPVVSQHLPVAADCDCMHVPVNDIIIMRRTVSYRSRMPCSKVQTRAAVGNAFAATHTRRAAAACPGAQCLPRPWLTLVLLLVRMDEVPAHTRPWRIFNLNRRVRACAFTQPFKWI